MRSKADFPQSRALALNYCSVSDVDGISAVTGGSPSAVLHEETEAHEGRSGTRSVEVELVLPHEGWSCRGDAGGVVRAGGGTPP